MPQISSTADHYPTLHQGHLTGKGDDLQPFLSTVQRRQNDPIVQTAVDPGKQVYLFINNLNLTDHDQVSLSKLGTLRERHESCTVVLFYISMQCHSIFTDSYFDFASRTYKWMAAKSL